ncbi:MAG: outer membrane protein assembly factor BamC [Alteromonadaceae bacterium]|nr:outer membrane protein assembly factor BamC [Alteromonadaceae bacterium]
MNLLKKFFAIAVTGVLLQSCSLFNDEQTVDHRYKYINAQESEALTLPSGADAPLYSEEFRVPQLGDSADTQAIGENLDIVSPALILPLVTGSRVAEGTREAVVEFDQVDDSQALDTTIWNSLINYLDERGIGVVSFDKETQKLMTDWMVIEAEDESPWYSWTKTDRTVGQRFEFKLELKPHGRSGALHAKLVDYLETVGDDVIADISTSQVRRNEIEVLNNVISHYEKQLRIEDARRLRKIKQGVDMELGFNANGDAAYILDANYEVAWPRLLLVLRKMGFNVKDLDKSTGIIFVNYAGTDEGWWSSLFSSSDDLQLEKEDYRLFVSQQGQKTSVTWNDADNNPLAPTVISDIYEPISQVMATEDLDI